MRSETTERGVREMATAAAILAGVALLGLACVLGPALAAGTKPMPAPLFPMLRAAIEKLDWIAPVLLCVLGVGCGLSTRLDAWWIGLASVSTLPLAAFAEIAADGTSHNLIPFELAMYAVLAVPGAIGALFGKGLRRMMS